MRRQVLRRAAFIIIFCSILPAALWGQCAANQWCAVYTNSLGFSPGLQDNGWHRIFFASDPNNPGTGRFYLDATGNVTTGTPNQQSTVISPFSNSLFSFTTLKSGSGSPAVATRSPWTEVSDCGDAMSNYAPASRAQHLYLKSGISANATSATFCVGYPRYGCTTGFSSTLPQSGSIWVDDEVIDYSSLSCNDPSGNCNSTGATQLTFNFPLTSRGQRQLAGWTAPTGHNQNAYAGLACPKTPYGPRLNGTLTTDAPTTRHAVGSSTFDSKRGRIWKAWGFQEVYSFQDTWYLCIFQTAYCSSTQIADGWFHLNLSGNTAGPYPSPTGKNPEGYSENDQIYVPNFDILYEFGGLHMGATDDAYVFCLSIDSTSVAACHSDQNAANAASLVLNQWMPVCNGPTCRGIPGAPIHGRAGYRDGGRMVFDPVHQKVLIFGGRSSSTGTAANPIVYWTSVAQWDPKTNDYCLSDTSQATALYPSFSGSHCSLPAMTGPAPLPMVASYFPDIAWDSNRNLMAVMQGNFYTYDPGQNHWILTGVAGGPPQPLQPNQQSMAYDNINDMYVAVTHTTSGFQSWELSGSALSAAGNTIPGFFLTTSPVSRTATPGQAATYTIRVLPQNGAYNSQIRLACTSGLPSGATCSFSPGTVTPGANAASTILTINLSPSTPNGSFVVNVVGTAGSVQHATAVALMMGQPNFVLSSSPGSATVTAGQSANYTVTVAGQNGFSSPVSLACAAGLPVGASCSFSPSSVTPGTNPVTGTLTISTAASSARMRQEGPHRPFAPVFAFWLSLPGIALVGMVHIRKSSRKRRLPLWTVGGLLLVLLTLFACGGGPTTNSSNATNPPGGGTVTQTGTYTVTLVGTSGSSQQSTTTTLVVQ